MTVHRHRSRYADNTIDADGAAMTTQRFALLALALFGLNGYAGATDTGKSSGSGHFRMADNGLKVDHVIAVRREEHLDPAFDDIFVYLSDHPLDAAKVAAAFDPDDVAVEQLGERPGGTIRLCLTADGGECGLFYRRRDPHDSFNTSGYGELTLDVRTETRIAGRWVLSKPEDFFGKPYDFDLRFDAAIAQPPGTPLPAGGGDAGTAYRTYAAAVAKGDIVALRAFMGDDARWRLPDNDDERIKETLKDLRDEQPQQPKILRGRLHGDEAVLWVEGVDRDDIKRRGRVRMVREGDAWRVGERDLESVEE